MSINDMKSEVGFITKHILLINNNCRDQPQSLESRRRKTYIYVSGRIFVTR